MDSLKRMCNATPPPTGCGPSPEPQPVALDPRHFRNVLGNYPTGVVMITASEGDAPIGMVVGSFSSVSLDPPLVSFLATSTSPTQHRIQQAGRFCANVLAADQEALCRKLARPGPGRLDDVPWQRSSLGNPVLEGIVAWIDCTLHDVIEIGDHTLIVGRVRELRVASDKTPLLFFRGQYGDYSSTAVLLLERLLDWQ